ncbi:MAG TPA: hypothetical protein VKE69_00215, partial [Planctomycetota bacterium]|nr:hypothetical protein [Planctomycetota bacterium]
MRITPLLLPALLAAPGFAQDVFICSNSDMILTRGTDRNFDGDAMDFGEYGKVAYEPSLLQNGREIKATSVFGAPGIVWLDQNTRDVTRLVDLNGNGTFEPTEIASVFDFPTKAGVASGDTFLIGLAEKTGGVFYVANNAFKTLPALPPATNGLYRVTGMATLPFTGAVTPAIRQSDVITAFENNSTAGAAVVNAGAWERLAIINSTQTILAYNTLDDAIYALRDLDADGKFTSPGEVVNFLNASGHKAGLGLSGDFFGGALSGYGAMLATATPAPANGNWTVLNAIEVDQSNNTVYVATTTTFATPNPAGRVFKCRDLNGNGTCNDPGE